MKKNNYLPPESNKTEKPLQITPDAQKCEYCGRLNDKKNNKCAGCGAPLKIASYG